jgi:xanthine dehydrogenase YagS FAD-binding subunit
VHTFTYERIGDPAVAIATLQQDPDACLIAGGTELVNWLKEGIVRPARLLDINGLSGLGAIETSTTGLRIGGLVRMADLAAHPEVRRDYPAICEALLRSASQQLRNMASMAGNLLQRTRCPYFRAEVELPCNKRRPGSGCAALTGEDRTLAILGWSEHCLATHPSDVAVALAALDAEVVLHGPAGERTVPVASFYRLPGDEPERDTMLERAELLTGISVPASSVARRSWYLKVRERTSYEFALVSVAAGIDVDGAGTIREARVALGGVAHGPWRLGAAERALPGVRIDDRDGLRAAVEDALAEARPRRHNGFKVELARRAVVRTLQLAAGAQPAPGGERS